MKTLFALVLLTTMGSALLTTAHARLVTQTVDYADGGVLLKGYLAYDDSKTGSRKLPGVLVIPEWWGLNDYAKKRADQLAEMGYVAFGVDMYGYGEVTENKDRAGQLAGPFRGKPLMAQRAKAGFDQLVKSGLVDPSKVAAIGFCFGGSAAQALAYTGAPLRGIVSFHGSPVPAPALVTGKVKTKFLLLNGGSDPTIKPDEKLAWLDSLRAAKIDFQSIDYPGAKHAFTNPDADRLATANGMTESAGYHETAARESWQRMKEFLKGLFDRR